MELIINNESIHTDLNILEIFKEHGASNGIKIFLNDKYKDIICAVDDFYKCNPVHSVITMDISYKYHLNRFTAVMRDLKLLMEHNVLEMHSMPLVRLEIGSNPLFNSQYVYDIDKNCLYDKLDKNADKRSPVDVTIKDVTRIINIVLFIKIK